MGRVERADEVGGGREVGPVPGLGGRDVQRDREVALADTGRPEEQRVAVLLDERSVDSSAMTARSMLGWKSNSNWARRLSSG